MVTPKGFIKVTIDKGEIDKLLKKYKNIKKYMKSSIYEVLSIDKNEKIVSELLSPSRPDLPNSVEN